MTAPAPLHYEVLGKGEPVVILHGLFGSGRNWFTLAKTLARDWQVILPDARNHGKSAHASTMAYPDMAGDIIALLAELGLATVHIIGHSMGGKTAMTLALRYPERIKSLTVLDIAPVTYHSTFDQLITAMLNLDLERIRSRGEANEALSASIPEAGLRAFLLHNLARRQDGYFWRVNLPLIRQEIKAICDFPDKQATSHYEAACLFLAGADSEYINTTHLAQIRHYFPGANVKQIAHAGHWLHAEQPETVLEEIQHFLASQAASQDEYCLP